MDLWARPRPLEDVRAADASGGNVSIVKEALAGLGFCAASGRCRPESVKNLVRSEIQSILTLPLIYVLYVSSPSALDTR